jgi:hypothetical protein
MKTLAEAIAAIEALQAQVKELQDGVALKQRGPKTDRAMTEKDAFRVKFGDLKPPLNHKEAASQLGLSYGQVFSCRGGYTFKHVKASWKPRDAAPEQTPEEPK